LLLDPADARDMAGRDHVQHVSAHLLQHCREIF
jgi:hypothetical protein